LSWLLIILSAVLVVFIISDCVVCVT